MEITIYHIFGQLIGISIILGYIIWRLEHPKQRKVSIKDLNRVFDGQKKVQGEVKL
jgi:hypothetical protein